MNKDNRAGPVFTRLKAYIYGESYKKPAPFFVSTWLTTHLLKDIVPIRRKCLSDYNEPIYLPFKFEEFKINIEL